MAVIESRKKLGFGMMRLPKRTDAENGELDNIDVEQVKEKLLSLAYIRDELAEFKK